MDSLSKLKQRRGSRRKAVALEARDLVRTHLGSPSGLPLIVAAGRDDLDLHAWAPRNRETIETHLREHGAVLFRGFSLDGVAGFERLVGDLFAEPLLAYTYRSTVRSRVSGRIYTSTEYPADQTIPQHNENAYTTTWPGHLLFHCLVAAEEGGETPLADSHAVYEQIDPAIRTRFEERGVCYVRNYRPDMDIPWQTVFQTEDRAEVTRYCEAHGIDCDWKTEDWLQTRQVCQAVIDHPVSGRPLWFNQAHLFHVSNLGPEIAASMIADFGEANLPRNATYGDGTPFDEAELAMIREVYARQQVRLPWEKGDVLLLDNMQVTHGRAPFRGDRKVVVGMSGTWTLGEGRVPVRVPATEAR